MLALPQHVGMFFLVTCMFGSRNVDIVVEFCCLHVVVGGFVSHVPWIPGGPTWWANHVLTCHVHVVSLVTNWAQGGPWIARRFQK